ncbi:unnamed protein product [Candidula unifasciata]|uniref:Uncharacterized protein n=1 Tax=Candidula unifasciata TaxID=100452 RepID=A0A8S3YVK8_9EUPU|nr:unnamed protein product [Candidula unifasciata]
MATTKSLFVPDVCGWLGSSCVWVYFFLASLQVTGVLSELCVYRNSKFNSFTDRYDKLLTTTECQWGCCYYSGAPCCTAPVSLIVGVVLGSVLVLSLGVAVLCCCCVCRKNQQRTQLVRAEGRARSTASQQADVIFHTETSHVSDLPDGQLYSDLPPSYDEVMRGESNHTFKQETT